MQDDTGSKKQGGLRARLARVAQALSGSGKKQEERPAAAQGPPVAQATGLRSLRRTPGGLVIATPENLAELLAQPRPPPRVWWEKAEMELCLVPSGEFLMGSADTDRDAGDDEKPRHQVYLDAFYVGRYPVTQAQYARFVQATGHRVPFLWGDWAQPYNWDRARKAPPGDRLDHPVVMVGWDDAAAFCRWAGLRLPTEAEWEKAARGTDGRIYPWGNTWDAGKCSAEQGKGGTTPVGAYSPAGDSPNGCADVAGNVWERVSDWYSDAYYRNSPARNPQGPDSGPIRALRGAAFTDLQRSVRCAARHRHNPLNWHDDVGFRVVVAPGSPSGL